VDDRTANLSASLAHVIREAEEIAGATKQAPNSSHVLLAFYTSRNKAERFLRDRGIGEDQILDVLDAKKAKEPKTAVREIFERAAQVAAGCGTSEVNSLHVLVAMTRVRDSLAFRLLDATGEAIPNLRTRALNILTGDVPRWLDTRYPPSNGESLDVAAASSMPSKTEQARRAKEDAPRRAAMAWRPPLITKPKAKPKTTGPKEDAKPAEAAPPPPQAPAIAPAPASAPAKETKPKRSPWALDPDSYPWLTSLGRNLSEEAASGVLDRLVGREKEIETLIDILGKRRANNPVLIGEPGVGKTALVEGLAQRLVKTPPTDKLGEKIIIGLDVGSLLVGTQLRGSFSEKLEGIKEEVKESAGRVIVFFDELHTLVGAGSTGDGPLDAADELKSALARGDFPCIGATTCDEYVKHIEQDAALKRRFVPVMIQEPTQDEAIEMIAQIMPTYAEHHGVKYAREAIETAVSLSARYMTDRHLPDKAIALLDLAGSRTARAKGRVVGRDVVAQLVSERTELPVERLLGSDRDRLLRLDSLLGREIVGHQKQLARIAEVIRRNAAGFSSKRPQGSFLFVGPTGVGKTETAKALAKVLHGSEDSMIRFDLSEFSEAHAVARLVGAPPGYVGYDAGGQLTEAVRKRPGRVILFDEIEKAHRDVLQLLLQILDDGRLTDGHGRTVSFAETIVIMTSNLGADTASVKRPIGFVAAGEARKKYEEEVLDRAKRKLSPELWARIEEKLVFAPLSREEVKQIARLLSAESSRRLTRERGITYELDDDALDFLLEQGGFDLALGARPMRQILQRIVEAPIAARILEGRLHADEHVIVSTRANGGLTFLVGEDRTSLSQRPRM
jgi:ATP-dependent Clp protease ATP-binding subunit ClpC